MDIEEFEEKMDIKTCCEEWNRYVKSYHRSIIKPPYPYEEVVFIKTNYPELDTALNYKMRIPEDEIVKAIIKENKA